MHVVIESCVGTPPKKEAEKQEINQGATVSFLWAGLSQCHWAQAADRETADQ